MGRIWGGPMYVLRKTLKGSINKCSTKAATNVVKRKQEVVKLKAYRPVVNPRCR